MKRERRHFGGLRPTAIATLLLLASVGCFCQPAASPSGPISELNADRAVALALHVASNYQALVVNQNIATEDIAQARAAFLPRIAAPTTFTYNSPERGLLVNGGLPRAPSFLNLNAIREYQSGVLLTGELDINGRLSATLRRNRNLLAAARAGTEVARRDLIVAAREAYYGVAFATARLNTVDRNVATAKEFERVTELMANGGEVPSVDLSRARLQTTTRMDEQHQARAGLEVATEGLRFLIGYDASARFAVDSLETLAPQAGEIDLITSQTSSAGRPEIPLIEAQRAATLEDARIARAERLPSITYNIGPGVDTGSLLLSQVNQHLGVSAIVSLSLPIFDWGISKSKERQARSRADILGLQRDVFDRAVNQQLVSARALATAAAERVRLASGGVVDAQRTVSTSMARYRAGEAPILEVTDAQNVFNLQQQTLNQGIYEYRVGIIRLEVAAGLIK